VFGKCSFVIKRAGIARLQSNVHYCVQELIVYNQTYLIAFGNRSFVIKSVKYPNKMLVKNSKLLFCNFCNKTKFKTTTNNLELKKLSQMCF